MPLPTCANSLCRLCTRFWVGSDERAAASRQEPHAVVPPVGIPAGGAGQTGIPTATVAELDEEYIARMMEEVLAV
jgi:hypothetical protein